MMMMMMMMSQQHEMMRKCYAVSLHDKISHLKRRKLMVDEESQSTNGDHEELHPERVVVPIVRCLKLHVDEVHGGISATDVDDLKETEDKRRNASS